MIGVSGHSEQFVVPIESIIIKFHCIPQKLSSFLLVGLLYAYFRAPQ
jgi:hypothetical protein